jgi:uncharacterized membrane protein
MKFSSFVVVYTLLSAAGAPAANAHEAHRKAVAATAEATQEERATHHIEVASQGEPSLEHVEPASQDSPTESHLHSDHQLPAGSDGEPQPVSILDWLGRLHPMVIHFPIALFLAAFVAELLFAVTRREMFRHALRFSLWGGAISAAIAAPLGWMFAASGATEQGWILEAHRWAGTSALFLGAAVLWIGEWTERANGSRLLLRTSLAVQAMLIAGVGHLGGSLLYGFDHLWRGL